MNIMREAFLNAGISPKMMKKKGKRQPISCNNKPLVIETRMRVLEGRVKRAPIQVSKVKHILSNGRVVTEGGDTWKYKDTGNNYYVAIGAF